MAEDLSSYLYEQDIDVRYLHSDIDTVERVEILRDLRLGKFDVLVGLNLLREGLDLPEVSLVAVLDADKEGFLRSETSLIQTIGRAARHKSGHAILYADQMTGSIERTIKETEHRRSLQEKYNKENNIKPESILKSVSDIMEGARNIPGKKFIKEAQELIEEDYSSPKELARRIDELESLMLEHANKLEFEEAANIRDQISVLKEKLIAA